MLEHRNDNNTTEDFAAARPGEATAHAEAGIESRTERDQALPAPVRHDLARIKRWNKRLNAFYFLVLLPAILFLLYQAMFGDRHMAPFIHIFNAINLGIGAACRKMLDRNAVARLGKWSDKGNIGLLVEVVDPRGSINYDKDTRHSIKQVLISLLPTLHAGDASLLTEVQRETLRKMLSSERETPEFQIAILKAFEQIGDWRCVPAVEKLIRKTKFSRVREAARSCLPFLQELAEKHKVGETLLRASDAPAEQSPETLLRAASAAEAVESPDELLRAGSNHEA